MKIGYARVSTLDQNLDLQIDALTKVGCEKIFTDKISSSKAHRQGLADALDYIRAGDTLVVWKLDRLCRNITELLKVSEKLKNKWHRAAKFDGIYRYIYPNRTNVFYHSRCCSTDGKRANPRAC
ncbi:recombinase family protein [Moraxella catarrhalis]|uniref:recombinase family protein n=1 Tax=Moraxella catarrhalis TaxID=480 RepID=UPI001F4D8737|nr:recombinase family protein [Moraxella catarrhalis]